MCFASKATSTSELEQETDEHKKKFYAERNSHTFGRRENFNGREVS